ncbi:LOW QUALITY PROTEIN: protein deacetylase HDAC6, partial [Cyanocitta cristata]
VLYVSLHRHDGSFFPGGAGGSRGRRGRGPGTGFTLNVGWGGPRVGDPEYLAALTRLVLPVACQFGPELVLVSAGFDAGRGDPLGGCLVSPQTFGLMTHLLGGLAGGRLVLVLELSPPRRPPGRKAAMTSHQPPMTSRGLPPWTPPFAAWGAAARGRPGGRGQGGPGEEPPPGPAPTGAAAAAPCWEEEEELEEGALYAVTPLLDCPHLGAVAPPPAGGALGDILPPPAAVCGSRRENWLCLSCHQVLCGRYVGRHMLEHGAASGHPLVLSLRDLAAWCYPCGGYVTHPVLLPTKTFIYRLKFGTDPPTPSF